MVALSQTWKFATQQPPSAQITRQTPLQRKTSLATPIRMVLRARYYDPASREFISPDPLEYVDGMSLFRGYFVLGAADPNGEQITLYNEPPQGATVKFSPGMESDGVIRIVIFGEEIANLPPGVMADPTPSEDGCTCGLIKNSNPVYPRGGLGQPRGRQYLDIGIPCLFGKEVVMRYDAACSGKNLCCQDNLKCSLYFVYSCTVRHSVKDHYAWTGPNRTGAFIEWGWEIKGQYFGKCG